MGRNSLIVWGPHQFEALSLCAGVIQTQNAKVGVVISGVYGLASYLLAHWNLYDAYKVLDDCQS